MVRIVVLLLSQLLLSVFYLFDAFIRRGQVFWHGTAQFANGLSNLLAYLEMGFVGVLLTLNVVPAKLLFCLRGTEQIGSELCAPHVVQNLVALFEPFSGV